MRSYNIKRSGDKEQIRNKKFCSLVSSGKPIHIDEVVKVETEINYRNENLDLDSNKTGAFVFSGLPLNEEQKISWFVILLTFLKKRLTKGRLS